MRIQGVHTFIQNRETLTQAYSDDRIAHLKGVRTHSRISRRNNHSPKEGESAPAWKVSMDDITARGENL